MIIKTRTLLFFYGCDANGKLLIRSRKCVRYSFHEYIAKEIDVIQQLVLAVFDREQYLACLCFCGCIYDIWMIFNAR